MGEPAWGAAGRIQAEGRSSVSTQQRENLDAILRQNAFPFDSDVSERELLGEPSAELTAMIAGSGVRLFRPFLSM
jgi:hypothetical protein